MTPARIRALRAECKTVAAAGGSQTPVLISELTALCASAETIRAGVLSEVRMALTRCRITRAEWQECDGGSIERDLGMFRKDVAKAIKKLNGGVIPLSPND